MTVRDRDWFDQLYRDNAPAVFAYARRRLRDREDAEDVVVEVFSVAWRRRRVVPQPERPWLYATAANVLAHVGRSAARRGRLDARMSAQPTAMQDSAADVASALDAQKLLAAAFENLAEPDREVLRLWAWEGLEGADLATALDCSPNAARTRLHRAKTRLRTVLATDENQGGVS